MALRPLLTKGLPFVDAMTHRRVRTVAPRQARYKHFPFGVTASDIGQIVRANPRRATHTRHRNELLAVGGPARSRRARSLSWLKRGSVTPSGFSSQFEENDQRRKPFRLEANENLLARPMITCWHSVQDEPLDRSVA